MPTTNTITLTFHQTGFRIHCQSLKSLPCIHTYSSVPFSLHLMHLAKEKPWLNSITHLLHICTKKQQLKTDKEKSTIHQQFSFQIHGQKSLMARNLNHYYSVTVKELKIPSPFHSQYPKELFHTFSFVLKPPRPIHHTTNNCIEKAEAVRHNFPFHHQNYLPNPHSPFPLPLKSSASICAPGLGSSHFLKELISPSVPHQKSLPQWTYGINIQTSSNISSHWTHIPLPWPSYFSASSRVIWLLSLSLPLFFPQFTPVRFLLLSILIEITTVMVIREAHLPNPFVTSVLLLDLSAAFSRTLHLEPPPSPAHTVITNDLHGRNSLFFFTIL